MNITIVKITFDNRRDCHIKNYETVDIAVCAEANIAININPNVADTIRKMYFAPLEK